MFQGYSPETVDFLWGIRLNNHREWFMANKQNYVKHLYEPTKALGAAVFEPFLDRPGDLLKVSRIYRDARMHHPVPYKESLWICIRKDVEYWGELPCLFFEINPEGVDYGFFFYKPRPAYMEAFRQKIAAEPRQFLQMICEVEEAVGIPVGAQRYKKPKPCDNEEISAYYSWKEQIYCTFHEDFSEDTFGPALAERVRSCFEKLIPLYDYFNNIV